MPQPVCPAAFQGACRLRDGWLDVFLLISNVVLKPDVGRDLLAAVPFVAMATASLWWFWPGQARWIATGW